ncbi:MAG: hypothetical protein ACK4UN_06535, partial [Limisphaerales bacterium]
KLLIVGLLPLAASVEATQSKGRASANAPKQAATEEPAGEPAERLSVFEEPLRPPYTDPFFPKSRRMPYRKEPEKTVVAAQPQTVLIDQIILKGITVGPVGKRLALINNNSFAAGESGQVRIPRGTVNIEVLEVGERSVTIRLENDPQPREIHLRPSP